MIDDNSNLEEIIELPRLLKVFDKITDKDTRREILRRVEQISAAQKEPEQNRK